MHHRGLYIVALGLLLASHSTLAQLGDECASPINVVVPGTSAAGRILVSGNTDSHTSSAGDGPPCAYEGTEHFCNDVWFQTQSVPVGTRVSIATNGNLGGDANFDTQITVYTACGGEVVTCNEDADAQYRSAVEFVVEVAGPVVIRLSGYDSGFFCESGDYVLSIAFGQYVFMTADGKFNPAKKYIAQGETVTWVNLGSTTQTVTADDASFDSGDVAAAAEFTHAFPTTGVYPYASSHLSSMTGSIHVAVGSEGDECAYPALVEFPDGTTFQSAAGVAPVDSSDYTTSAGSVTCAANICNDFWIEIPNVPTGARLILSTHENTFGVYPEVPMAIALYSACGGAELACAYIDDNQPNGIYYTAHSAGSYWIRVASISDGTTCSVGTNQLVLAFGTWVGISSDGFLPNEVTINVGEVVTWINQDEIPHTVTPFDSSFISGPIFPGTIYQAMFTSAGDVEYFSESKPSMTGTVHVVGCTQVCGDPHFTGLDGVKYEFLGLPNKTFAIISDPSVQINSHFISLKKPRNITKFDFTTYLGATCIRTCGHKVMLLPGHGVSVDGHMLEFNRHFESPNLRITRTGRQIVQVDVPNRWHFRFDMAKDHLDIDVARPLYKWDNKTHGVLGHTLKYTVEKHAEEKCNVRLEGGCEVEGDYHDYEVLHSLCATEWTHSMFNEQACA